MSIIDKNWFWISFAALIFLISFFLIYLQQKFSTPAILTLSIFILLFILIIVSLFLGRVKSDINRTGKLITDMIVPNKQAQKEYMRVTLDALQKAGNTGILLTKTTVPIASAAFAKGYASGLGNIAQNFLLPF